MPKYKRSFDVLFSNYRKELFVKLENLNKQNKNLNKNYLDEVNKLNKLINLDLNISSISEKLKLFN